MSDSARLRVGISAEQAVSVGIDPAFYRGDPAIPNLHIGTVEARGRCRKTWGYP